MIRLAFLCGYLTLAHGFGESPFYYANWCNNEGSASLQYLDDKYCAKVFPSTFDRDNTCPISASSGLDPAVWVPDSVALADAPVNTTALEAAGVPDDVQLCLFLVKRSSTLSGSNGIRTKRFCSGGGETVSFETWSSSKFIAIGNAAGKLREECTDSFGGAGALGLESNTTYSSGECAVNGVAGTCSDEASCSGAGGTSYAGYCNGPTAMQCCVGASSGSSSDSGDAALTPLGDLATVVASYDTTAGLSSNAVSSYFHDLGWRSRALALATDWLAPPPDAGTPVLGGNYGESTPEYLGFDLSDSASDAAAPSCSAEPDPPTDGPYSNSLTALALAEAHRRLALHREVAPELTFPNATWEDASTALYGARSSAMFPGVQWGGLSTDPAIFIQTGVEKALEATGVLNGGDPVGALAEMDAATDGSWRVFSKLGAGYSSSRSVGEVVTAGYGCVPFGEEDDSWEFTLAARGSVALDFDLSKAEAKVIAAVEAALVAMAVGALE